MPNKKDNLQGAADHGAEIMNAITNGPENKKSASDELAEKGKYRFNLILPIEYKDYLHAAAYYAGGPKRQISITKYIQALIDDDIKRSGGDPKNGRKFD